MHRRIRYQRTWHKYMAVLLIASALALCAPLSSAADAGLVPPPPAPTLRAAEAWTVRQDAQLPLGDRIMREFERSLPMWGASVFDYATTQWALDLGYRELNPILGQGRARQAWLIFGSTAALDLITRWLERDENPQWARVTDTSLRFVKIGVHTSAGVANWRLIGKGPPNGMD